MTQNGSVPGTLHLVDIEGNLSVKHASHDQPDVVLIPAPSDDPDDPLNWSTKRKLLSTASISMCVCHLCLHQSLILPISYTFAIGTTSAAIYSILSSIEEDTGLTLNDLNAGTGYMVKIQASIASMLKTRSSYCLGGAACSGSLSRYNMESDLCILSLC